MQLAQVRSCVRQHDFKPMLEFFLTQSLDHAAYSALMGEMFRLLDRTRFNMANHRQHLFDGLIETALYARARLHIQSCVLTFMSTVLVCDGPIIEALAWAERCAFARASKLFGRAFRWLNHSDSWAFANSVHELHGRLEDIGLRLPHSVSIEHIFNVIIFT